MTRILVVDDDPGIRFLCQRFLEGEGRLVEAVENGDVALARLGEGWDIVLTDLDMPGSVDGNTLTRKVRTTASTDVIIMTGNPELDTAVRALRDGAYDYLIKPFSADTLGNTIQRCLIKRHLSRELAREKSLRVELDKAYSELKRMDQVREIFGQFATPEVARFVLDHPGDFRSQGELRLLTVFFCDVRGFTPFAGRVSPQEAVSSLNEVFDRVIGAVVAEGGVPSKFLGDGLMALFGAPAPLEDHAARAARAALEARRRMAALNEERKAGGREPLRLGIGINTGMMVAGCVGTRSRTEYTVIGHPVNLASRLEEVASADQILLGPETAKALAGAFELAERGALTLQGIAEPVPAVELVGTRSPSRA